jgi:hypothetical protein
LEQLHLTTLAALVKRTEQAKYRIPTRLKLELRQSLQDKEKVLWKEWEKKTCVPLLKWWKRSALIATGALWCVRLKCVTMGLET